MYNNEDTARIFAANCELLHNKSAEEKRNHMMMVDEFCRSYSIPGAASVLAEHAERRASELASFHSGIDITKRYGHSHFWKISFHCEIACMLMAYVNGNTSAEVSAYIDSVRQKSFEDA